jgi:beta-glucanase (GH16 family)
MEPDPEGETNMAVPEQRSARPHPGLLPALSLVAVLVATTAVVVPGRASAAARMRVLGSGAVLTVMSGDGCKLKPARFSTTPVKTRRDFTCTRTGAAPWVIFNAPGSSQVLYNGDTLSVVANGCKLKLRRSATAAPKFARDVWCAGSSGGPPSAPASGGSSQPPGSVTGGVPWTTVWADDFDGSAVSSARWNVMNNSNFGSGNHEDQCYRAANVSVAGGTLRLVGQRQSVTNCGANPDGGSTYFFTSGMVTTRAQGGPLKMKYRHGYTEVRMRVPRGNIYWPAFWLVGAGDGSSPGWPAYGEVDVTEIYGSKPDISESNFHRTGGNIGARNHNVNSPPSSTAGRNVNPPNPFVAGGVNAWHRYGLSWSANRLDWYVDGVLVRSYAAATVADRSALGYEHSLILNLAMGGNGPRYPDHGYTGQESGGGYNNGNLVADLPGVMEVDYVRVWQP